MKVRKEILRTIARIVSIPGGDMKLQDGLLVRCAHCAGINNSECSYHGMTLNPNLCL